MNNYNYTNSAINHQIYNFIMEPVTNSSITQFKNIQIYERDNYLVRDRNISSNLTSMSASMQSAAHRTSSAASYSTGSFQSNFTDQPPSTIASSNYYFLRNNSLNVVNNQMRAQQELSQLGSYEFSYRFWTEPNGRIGFMQKRPLESAPFTTSYVLESETIEECLNRHDLQTAVLHYFAAQNGTIYSSKEGRKPGDFVLTALPAPSRGIQIHQLMPESGWRTKTMYAAPFFKQISEFLQKSERQHSQTDAKFFSKSSLNVSVNAEHAEKELCTLHKNTFSFKVWKESDGRIGFMQKRPLEIAPFAVTYVPENETIEEFTKKRWSVEAVATYFATHGITSSTSEKKPGDFALIPDPTIQGSVRIQRLMPGSGWRTKTIYSIPFFKEIGEFLQNPERAHSASDTYFFLNSPRNVSINAENAARQLSGVELYALSYRVWKEPDGRIGFMQKRPLETVSGTAPFIVSYVSEEETIFQYVQRRHSNTHEIYNYFISHGVFESSVGRVPGEFVLYSGSGYSGSSIYSSFDIQFLTRSGHWIKRTITSNFYEEIATFIKSARISHQNNTFQPEAKYGNKFFKIQEAKHKFLSLIGVTSTSSLLETYNLRKTWCRKHHPDRQKDNSISITQVNNAWDELCSAIQTNFKDKAIDEDLLKELDKLM